MTTSCCYYLCHSANGKGDVSITLGLSVNLSVVDPSSHWHWWSVSVRICKILCIMSKNKVCVCRQIIPFILLYSFPRDHSFTQSPNIHHKNYLDCLNLLFSKYNFLIFNFVDRWCHTHCSLSSLCPLYTVHWFIRWVEKIIDFLQAEYYQPMCRQWHGMAFHNYFVLSMYIQYRKVG